MHAKRWKRGDDTSDQEEGQSDISSDPTGSQAEAETPVADEPGDPAPPLERPAISPGDIGPDVLYLQQRIGVAGSGKFDAATEASVKVLQEASGLPVSGTVDAATWQKIEGEQR